jgi:hypothetical protein
MEEFRKDLVQNIISKEIEEKKYSGWIYLLDNKRENILLD